MNQRLDPDDVAAFMAAVDGAEPLRVAERISFERPKPSARPRQRELDEAAAIAESLESPLDIDDLIAIGEADSFLRSGLPRTVLRDLRRGRWAIQRHLDLHGLNRHQAHDEVAIFLAEAAAADKRCVRIVHGRGHGSPGARRRAAPIGQRLAGAPPRRAGVLPRAGLRRRPGRAVGAAQIERAGTPLGMP